MKKIYTFLTVIAILAFSHGKMNAQCISPNSFAGTTANSNGTVTATTCAFAGEYSPITFTLAGNYVFNSTGGAGNFITITNSLNVVIGSGYAPLGVTIPSTGVFRCHVSLNPACGTENVCRTITVVGTNFCNSGGQFGSGTINANGTTVLTTCAYGGEFSVATFTSTGVFTITSTGGAGNYITLKNVAGNVVYAQGLSPIVYTISATGVYHIHLATSGPPTCGTDSQCHTISVTGPPLPPVCSGAPAAASVVATSTSICAASNSSLSLSTTYTVPGITYQWSSAALLAGPYTAIPGATLSTYAATSLTTTTFYRAVITCSAGPVSTTATAVQVSVTPIPTITVNSGAICSGSSFTMVPSGAASYTFQGGSAIKNPTVATNYTVVGSTNGCISNIATSTITVNPNPTVSVTGGTICSGSSFTLNPTGASSYSYSPSGPVVTPSANASYTITGTTAGCPSAPVVASLTVNATPTVVVAGVAICTGGSFTLNPTGATSYSYSTGPVVTPTANASYTVTGTTAGCSGNAVASVTVNSNPTVTAVSSLSLICNGQTASLTASGASTYSWNTSATTSVVAVSPSVTTSYTVTGTDANLCSNSAVITQSVSACTGLNNTVASSIGVVVYPNPNNGLFTIELNNGSVKTIEVMDLTGRIVLANTTSNNKVDFNISTLANGVYYVRVQANNSVEVIKIVKQ